MAKKVNFNDGEALVHTDLNTLQQRQRIELMRHLASSWMIDSNYTVQSCNPTKVRPSVTGNTLTMGITHWAFGVTPATDDDPTGVLAELPAINQAVTATTATFFRQDIIAVRLTENVNAAAVSVDFRDEATRALSTTTNVKTISDNIDFEVVEGVEQTTEALALANPPAPSAGFTAVAGYILADTGANVDTLVHVPPIGQRTTVNASIIDADPGLWAYLGVWNIAGGNSNGGNISIIPIIPPNMFIESVTLHYTLADNLGTAIYNLATIDSSAGTANTFLNIKSLLTLLDTGTTQVTTIDFGTQLVAPIWSVSDSKGHHPAPEGNSRIRLQVNGEQSGATSSNIRMIEFTGIVWNGGGQ